MAKLGGLLLRHILHSFILSSCTDGVNFPVAMAKLGGLLLRHILHSFILSSCTDGVNFPVAMAKLGGLLLRHILHSFILSSCTDGVNLPVPMAKLGGLLLRHILQLVCNAHAITSVQTESHTESSEHASSEGSVSSTEQTRVATAIYPTASLMNHSCDPTIVSR